MDAIWALGLRKPIPGVLRRVHGRLYIGDMRAGTTFDRAGGGNLGVRAPTSVGRVARDLLPEPIPRTAARSTPVPTTEGHVDHRRLHLPRHTVPGAYQGNYFYADYAQNWIKRSTLDMNGNVTGSFDFEPPMGHRTDPRATSYLCQGPAGHSYYVDLGYSDTTGRVGVSGSAASSFISSDQPAGSSSPPPSRSRGHRRWRIASRASGHPIPRGPHSASLSTSVTAPPPPWPMRPTPA